MNSSKTRKKQITNRIFFSYVNTDKAWAQWVEDIINRIPGTSLSSSTPFKPGVNFVRKTMESLKKSDVIVVLWTHAAASSEWIAAELGASLALKKPIIVLAETPDILKQPQISRAKYQALNLEELKKNPVLLPQLLKSIREEPLPISA